MTTTTKSRGPARRLALLGLAAAGGFALLSVAAAGAAVTDVTIANFRFSPNPVTIPVGDTLQWTNQDGTTHTVTSDDGHSFDSGPRPAGATYTHTFDQSGTFAYHCNIHPSMRATVKVGDGTTTTVAPPTTTTSGPATTTTRPPTTATTGRVTTTTATTPPGSTPTGATPSEPAPPSTAHSTTPPTTTARTPASAAPGRVTTTEPSTSLPHEWTSTPLTTATTAAPAPPPTATPPTAAVALGVARSRGGHGSGRTGLVAAGVGLILGSAGWWVGRRRRRSALRFGPYTE